MEVDITRINSYDDDRFSATVLMQHGAFLVAGKSPYEVEIIGANEAVVRGERPELYEQIIEEFRFYAEHITQFYDEKGALIQKFPDVHKFQINLEDIQPSQFYVDRDKKRAVASFTETEKDVIIPLLPYGERYISLDGHTRMSVAIDRGLKQICGFLVEEAEYIYPFVEEAVKRNILTPYDMEELPHDEYEIKWNKFCEEF